MLNLFSYVQFGTSLSHIKGRCIHWRALGRFAPIALVPGGGVVFGCFRVRLVAEERRVRGRPSAPARQRGYATRGGQQEESGSVRSSQQRFQPLTTQIHASVHQSLRYGRPQREGTPQGQMGSPLFMQEHDSVPGQVCDSFGEAHIFFAEDNGSVHLPFADIHDIGEGSM